MFGTNVEVDWLQEQVRRLKDEVETKDGIIKTLENTITFNQKIHEIEEDKAKHEMAKEVQKRLVESDLKRVEARAKLDAYLDMDIKDERKHLVDMLEEAIKSLGQQKVMVHK